MNITNNDKLSLTELEILIFNCPEIKEVLSQDSREILLNFINSDYLNFAKLYSFNEVIDMVLTSHYIRQHVRKKYVFLIGNEFNKKLESICDNLKDFKNVDFNCNFDFE